MNTIIGMIAAAVLAQTPAPQGDRFIDPVNGATVETLVARANERYGELRSAAETLARTRARVRQTSLPAPSASEEPQAGPERRLAADVRRRYVDAVAAARKLKAIADSVDLARESHRVAHARVGQGRIPRRVADETFVEVSRMEAARLAAESQAEIALLALKRIVGLGPEEPLRLRGEGIDRPIPPEAEGLERALAARTDLVAARVADTLAPGALVPPARRTLDASAPVALTAARHLRQYAVLTVRHEVRAAYARVEKTRQAHDVYRQDVLDEALANTEVVRKAYELEGASPLEYLAQEKSLVDLEVKYADVWKEYMDAVIDLDFLVAK